MIPFRTQQTSSLPYMSARRPYFNPRAQQPSGARHPHRGQSHAAATTQRSSVPHSHSSLQASAPPSSQQHNAPMGYVSGQSLQSHPFPGCVTDVLGQIVQFIRAHGVKWTRVKATDLQSRIDVDLFCLGADRRVSRLSEIQRLKLVGILCNFFATVSHSCNYNSCDPYLSVISTCLLDLGREL
jgi:hypothetical protein